MIDAITATENTIMASLKRHGKRFVQCLVFSKIDMLNTPVSWQQKLGCQDPDPAFAPVVMVAVVSSGACRGTQPSNQESGAYSTCLYTYLQSGFKRIFPPR
jgi:hypothetical protein